MLHEERNVTYDANKKEIILTDCDLKVFPANVVIAYANDAEYIDISCNRITDLNWVHAFENLKYLILDANRLHEVHLRRLNGSLQGIKVLMLNKNELSDLKTTIELLKKLFPNLEYLSLHGNPICPDGLELQPFSEYVGYNYDFYKSYIISSFPLLKFLDHSDIRRPLHRFVQNFRKPQPTTKAKLFWFPLKKRKDQPKQRLQNTEDDDTTKLENIIDSEQL